MLTVIVESALRSSALIAIVWLLLRVAGVRNPSLERSAWLAVLVASLAMPWIMELAALPVANAPAVAWLQSVELITNVSATDAFNWQYALLWMYAGIAGLLILRQIIGTTGLWRLRASARPLASDRDVRASHEVSSPATVFSTVLVPADFASWDASERNAVLAHERSHVANKDFYVQWLAHLQRNVFWFNPLAWWLPRRLSLLSEHISDDAALAAVKEPTAYAQLLLTLAHNASGNEQAIAMARAATLASRVERILECNASPCHAGLLKRIGTAAILVPFVALAAGFQTQEEEPVRNAVRTAQPLAQRSDDIQPAAAREVVLPKSNKARPLSQPVYPPVSRRLLETGTVVLKLHVLEDGSVADAAIDKSSGYPDLDYAAMYESFRWKLDPGTVDGEPQRMWGQFAVTFKLSK